MRKEVDDAVAQAKVILWAVFVFVIVYVKTVNNAKFLLVLTLFQESPRSRSIRAIHKHVRERLWSRGTNTCQSLTSF